jgi:hypothetical protein
VKASGLVVRLLPLLCLLFLFGACSATPRVSTPTERAEAIDLLATAEVALEAAIASGAVRAEDVQAARTTVTDLRAEIEQSEFVPVAWSGLLKRATALSIRWVAQKG